MREDRLVIATQASSARSAAQIATAMTLGEDDLALRAVRGQRGQFEAVRREDGTVTARVSTKRERGQIIAEVCPARQGNRRIITRCYENADMETLTARLALTPKAMHAFAEQIPALADESLRRNEIVRAEPVREWCEGTGWLPDDYTERTCAVLANTAQCEDGCMNVSAAVCEAIRCAPYRSSDTAALVDILVQTAISAGLEAETVSRPLADVVTVRSRCGSELTRTIARRWSASDGEKGIETTYRLIWPQDEAAYAQADQEAACWFAAGESA